MVSDTRTDIWSVVVGKQIPGLGTVIDKKQMCPDYHAKVRYSGNNGELVLIVRHSTTVGVNKFLIGKWLYGEEDPEVICSAGLTLDAAYEVWKTHTHNM